MGNGSQSESETTTVRIRKSVQQKLKRLAALEGMTLFELMDKITTEVVAECEENGYDLTPVDRRSSTLEIQARRRKRDPE